MTTLLEQWPHLQLSTKVFHMMKALERTNSELPLFLVQILWRTALRVEAKVTQIIQEKEVTPLPTSASCGHSHKDLGNYLQPTLITVQTCAPTSQKFSWQAALPWLLPPGSIAVWSVIPINLHNKTLSQTLKVNRRGRTATRNSLPLLNLRLDGGSWPRILRLNGVKPCLHLRFLSLLS